MITRRAFLKYTGGTALTLFAFNKFGVPKAIAQIPGGTLDPTSIPKYHESLVIPPAMPITAINGGVDYYEIAVRQFRQQILPIGLPMTTVWSYGSVNHPGTFNYPAFTIEAAFDRPVRVKWINGLVDSSGNFLPHLLPVDPTLHWANPPGGTASRDTHPDFTGKTYVPLADFTNPSTQYTQYTGPVPIVTHLHGGHTTEESDGYAESWYLPTANNIPQGFATEGSFYGPFKQEFFVKHGVTWEPGSATFQYTNDQRASTLWYHDHTLGMTRLNVYAGPAGFYLIRGGPDDLPQGVLPETKYEIPVAIQDRSFNTDGSLFYPSSRAFFDGFTGPYIPGSDIAPIFNPEFFGNTIVVNGRTWPKLEVEPRRYRFRFLNGCNSRFLILKMVINPTAKRPETPVLPFWQIGSEGGFLPKPVMLRELLIGLAERADVIVDFSHLRVGTEVHLINEGPDEPFGGGVPGKDFAPADPETTGQVMKLVVVPLASQDDSTLPQRLVLPTFTPLGAATNTRKVSLNEVDSSVLEGVGPRAALLGTIDTNGNPVLMGWDDPITENPALNSIEIWEIYNFTEDAHPIHIHEVQFQVVDRQEFDDRRRRPPEKWETGFKDTVIAYPEEITRVKALFDNPGLFVWHCHIVEHEDHEMMRPYRIGPVQPGQPG